MPDYKIKEILSYGDKVTDQADGKTLVKDQKDSQDQNKFGELAIEVNKLEDIEEDSTKVVKSRKDRHHEEPADE